MYYRFLRFPDGKPKAVTFSYDDGQRHDLRMLETMDKYGIKCTINVNNSVLTDPKRINPSEIREHILDKGHELAVHTATHKAAGKIRAIEGIKEVLECRLALEKEFGMIIRGMAYPDSGITFINEGITKDEIKSYLKQLDIAYSRSLAGDNDRFEIPNDWHEWIPTAHHTNKKIFEYIDKFVNIDIDKIYKTNRTPKLFYVWGHSFEFDRENNWELLDEICSKLGNRDDTWYATNIEIYDYVKAYDSLVFSADSSMIYNPTLITVWFAANEKLYKIAPGETITVE